MIRTFTFLWSSLLIATSLLGTQADNDVHDPALYRALEYRLVGPHKGSRVTGITGVPQDPGVLYRGATGGGVWKTTDARPTDAARQRLTDLEPELGRHLERLRKALDGDGAGLNDEAREVGVGPIVLPSLSFSKGGDP